MSDLRLGMASCGNQNQLMIIHQICSFIIPVPYHIQASLVLPRNGYRHILH